MWEAFGRFVIGARWPVLLVLALITVVSLSLLPSARFDFTPQALFEQQDETNQFAQNIRANFGDDTNTLMILWQAPVASGGIYAPETLTGIVSLTRELEALASKRDSHIRRVTSLANLRLPRNEPDPDDPENTLFSVGPLLEASPVTAEQAKLVQAASAKQPLVDRLLVSRDAHSTMLLLELDEEARNVELLVDIVESFQEKMPGWERDLPGKPKLLLSGLPAIRVEIIETLRSEQALFIPIAAGLMMLGLLWMFRRLSGVLLPMGTVTLASIWTIAWIVFSGQPINIINNILPTLLMIIGLSDSIHMLSRMAEEHEQHPERRDAIRTMVKHMGLACFLTSFTTAIGFGSLALARTEILRRFGLDAALGVMLAYVISMLFIPALLTWIKPPVKSAFVAREDAWLDRHLMSLARLVIRRPAATLMVGLVIGGAALAVGYRVEVNVFLLEAYPEDHATPQLTRQVERDFAGVLPMVVSLEGGSPGFFEKPDNLQKLVELQRRINTHEGFVLSTLSIHDLLISFRDAFKPSLAGQPLTDARQIHTVLELYRREAGSDLKRFISDDASHAIIITRIADAGVKVASIHIKQITDQAAALFGESAVSLVRDTPDGESHPAPSALKPDETRVRFSGDIYLASKGLMQFIGDLLSSLGLAFVLIFVTMTLLFRSLRIGLISIIPNVLPLLTTFGLMGIQKIDINTSSIIIFSISLGLAVDDTIHFLTRYQEECVKVTNIEDAILNTFKGAGRAIVMTSAVLIGGLGVLNFSNFVPTQLFSLLTGATVLGALLGDLFILPACLMLFDKGRFKNRPASPPTPLSPSPTLGASSHGEGKL